jgi:phosphoserine phosphatase
MDTPPVIVVDLDGTLIASDALIESCMICIRKNPLFCFLFLYWFLSGGKAFAKTKLADRIIPDAARLPYNNAVIDFLTAKKAENRVLVLASASDQRIVRNVAEHIGLFDHYFGTTPDRNLKGLAKRECIETFCQGRPYGYIGNSRADIPLWESASQAYIVSRAKGLIRILKKMNIVCIVI